MSNTPRSPDRRQIIAAAASLAASSSLAASPGRAMPNAPLVTVLGDSITSGYGLPAKDALPAQLQTVLDRLGVNARIHGAGVSGDTTASGLKRVDSAVPADTRLCVVALGGNDLLQFLPPDATRKNLDAIVARLQQKGMAVLVAGVTAPPQLGDFARVFNATFAEVARAHHAQLYPDLLNGVMLNAALNQRDGIHPNARGVGLIAQRLAPVIRDSLGG